MPLAYLNLIGRTGNILFQYAHARAWCEQNGHELSMHPWYGERVFNIPQAVRPCEVKPDVVWQDELFQEQADINYTRRQVHEWFSFQPHVVERLKEVVPVDLLFSLRQGQDVRDAGLVTLGTKCYEDAAIAYGYDPQKANWEIDTSPTRISSFGYGGTGCGSGCSEVSIPAFYRMMTAKVLFRANSTFDFWAATLSTGKVFAPVIRGLEGGKENVYCGHFVEGNWPTAAASHTDWRIPE